MYFGPKWNSYRYCEVKVHIHVGTSALVLVREPCIRRSFLSRSAYRIT